MSALQSRFLDPAAYDAGDFADRPHRMVELRAVPQLAARMPQRLFWGALMGVILTGTTLLLLLNVTLQNQAFELRSLHAQADELTNSQFDLERRIADEGSADKLAERATAMGMVPNTSPGFVLLPDGTVVGDPRPAAGPGPYASAAPKATTRPTATPSPTTSETARPATAEGDAG